MNKAETTIAESHGFLLDGESPTPVEVRITLLDTSLRFTQLLQRKSQLWDFADIDWEATRSLNEQLRLKKRDEDIWLVVTAPALIHEINNERQQWVRRNFWTTHPDLRMALRASLGTLLVCGSLWLGWPLLTKPIAALVPHSTREWLGNTAQNIVNMNNVCTDPAGQAALDQLTARLTINHPELRHIQVVPVHSSMINALTLANDKVLLTSAIIKQATSPDEVAGILAHEFGHIAHRHVLRSVLGEMLMQTLIMVFTGAHSKEVGYANDLTNNAHSRAFEAEADETAIALLADAKISSHGLAEFFNRIGKQENTTTNFMRYFVDHPPSAEREQQMLKNTIPDATPALSLQEWQNVQQMCGADEQLAPKQHRQPPPPSAEQEDL